MIKNLTKENFWNKMQEDYPKAMKKFCDWIDKYKEENNWDKLFHNGYKIFVWVDENHHSKGGQDKIAVSPKYHELPLAFQFGIFTQFQIKVSKEYYPETFVMIDYYNKSLLEDSKGIIENTLRVLEITING